MKKRTHQTFAALLSAVMLTGTVAFSVSAEESVSETGFPEGLTYQQICEMSEEAFLALPYAEKMVKDIHQYETSFSSYYLELNRKPNCFSNGFLVFQKDMITRELKLVEHNGHTHKQVLYHLPEEYTEALTAYYGAEIAEKALADMEAREATDFYTPEELVFQEDTGITFIAPQDDCFLKYVTTKFNDGLEKYDGLFRYQPSEYSTPEEIEQDPGLLVSFYLDGTLDFSKVEDPVKETEKVYDWTEERPTIRYIYDYDILWQNSVEIAKQYYGYFYVFRESAAILPSNPPLGGQPYEPVCGDANADGMVTITDVIYLQKSIAGLLRKSNTTKTNGDLYYDSVIDERDVETLMRHLVGLEETLPVVPEA